MSVRANEQDIEPELPYRVFSDRLLEIWAPRGPRTRLIATDAGVAEITINDRFTEQIIDLHWQELAAYISSGNPDRLSEFAGLVLEGHRLASKREDVAACFRPVGKR